MSNVTISIAVPTTRVYAAGAQLQALVTADVNVADLTAGDMTIHVVGAVI